MDQIPKGPVPQLLSLATTGWLAQQPREFQERMTRLGRWISINRGSVVYTVDDEADAIYGLGEGMLDVAIPVSDDKEVVVHRALPGFWVGDAALLAGSRRTISLYAASDSRLFKLPAVAVVRSLKEYPDDWMCFYRLSHANTTISLRTLAEVISLPPRTRFARALQRLTSTGGEVRLTQQELGRMVGMSRAAFRRSFAELIAQGIVKVEYGGVIIRDRAALDFEASRNDD